MQKVQGHQEDLAWVRTYFSDSWRPHATDGELLMLAVYLNVVKGFVPQALLPMHDARAAGALTPQRCMYEIPSSAVHTAMGILVGKD